QNDIAPAINTPSDGKSRTLHTAPKNSIRPGWLPPQIEPAARKRPSSSTPSPVSFTHTKRQKCKGCLETICKGCHEIEHPKAPAPAIRAVPPFARKRRRMGHPFLRGLRVEYAARQIRS